MEPILVHLSDWHLHPPLAEPGRRVAKLLGLKTHAYFPLAAAMMKVKEIMIAANDRPVIVALTGDITTAGDALAFQLAKDLLERRLVTSNTREYELGLGLSDNVCIIPGNHDRYKMTWMFRQNNMFEEFFAAYLPMDNWTTYGLKRLGTGTSDPAELPFIKVVQTDTTSTALVIIGLDSTALATLERLEIAGRAARGRVSADSLKYLVSACQDIDKNRSVTSSDGVRHQFGSQPVRRIALLHHHPYIPLDIKYKYLTRLVNAQQVNRAFAEGRIDMALYGHEHIPFVDLSTLQAKTKEPWRQIFAAAGSTSVYNVEKQNSFNVYDFDANGVTYQIWRFDGTSFIPDSASRFLFTT